MLKMNFINLVATPIKKVMSNTERAAFIYFCQVQFYQNLIRISFSNKYSNFNNKYLDKKVFNKIFK
jgi:hypothetical protein